MNIKNIRLGFLVDCFMVEMHRYDHGRTGPILHAANLTTPQLAVLELTRESQTISAVAAYLGLSRPATSQLVEKLVGRNLVRRTQGKEDRREQNVTLSPSGKALLSRISAARSARFNSSLAVLSPSLAAQFELILREVIDAISKGSPGKAGPGLYKRTRSRKV